MIESMEKIVALCKNRGYIYPGSEIYGGLANTWDYGPLGVELKNNVKAAWRKKFIQENKYNVGLDAAIFMNPETWVATGHVAGFSDPLIDCKECKTRHRADKPLGQPLGHVAADLRDFAVVALPEIHVVERVVCAGKIGGIQDIVDPVIVVDRRVMKVQHKNLTVFLCSSNSILHLSIAWGGIC